MEVDEKVEDVLTLLCGSVLGAVADVGVEKLLLEVWKNPRLVGKVYANDVITASIFALLTALGLSTKNKALTLIGAGGLACELGQELMEHLGQYVLSSGHSETKKTQKVVTVTA